MNKQDIERIIDFRQELHRFPELSGAEQQTAERIVCMLRAIGVDEIYQNIGGHGVVGVIHGLTAGASVGLRADMDALPIAETNVTGHASEHQGVMHACGHDGHAAMLIGAAMSLLKNRPASGRVVLIFQPAEELGTGAPRCLRTACWHVSRLMPCLGCITGPEWKRVVL
ncbi:M20/M25/M40 family metallo-hydrolase [Oceanimonas sp. NS1]|nr:M20/M25/M40 family metallo-hydrolase [Oceanimonas sp. NS1]